MKKKSILLYVILSNLIGAANATSISNGILNVGVNDNGTINDASGLGITYVGYHGADYTYPGTPFQFYSIGIDGVYASNASDGSGTSFSAATTTSASGANTIGNYGDMSFNQNMALSGSAINFSVTLTNNSVSIFNDVAYASGFDPDQDLNTHGTFDTNNTIFSGYVAASGSISNASISIIGDGIGSISSPWSMNPYIATNAGNGDNAISMLWAMGALDPGASKTINYSYFLTGSVPAPSTVPVPSTVWLLGSALIGLVGVSRNKSALLKTVA
ncbi:MAG: hypothetical protein NTV00_01345 [Methylococcales bacterium]|nr:hypothetical protein [Methylococcales bacterium]